ncbi:MAG: hypothetical protein QM723_01610 [Myxococcaceae bacterium]
MSLLLAACGGEKMTPDSGVPHLPALSDAVTTETKTLFTTDATFVPALMGPSSTPQVLLGWTDAGYGDETEGPGEPPMPQQPPMMVAPAPGAHPKRLVRFVHLPDTQLADDESPNRVVSLDQPGQTNAAYRPQEGMECRILNAAVRTINALHRKDAIDFVLTGGDNSDSAQHNEVAWFMAIMDGAARVKCDSGAPDDPVPGPFNDGKDEFAPEGLAMPWWWVTGNHDVLVQGNFAVTMDSDMQAVGTNAPAGTRNDAKPGGPAFMGPVVADPERSLNTRAKLMAQVGADKDGHGIGATQMASGKATYSFDVAGSPLRFIIFDTCDEDGDSEGIIHQADIDSTIKPLLDAAKAENKLVVIASHHSSSSIDDGSGFAGSGVHADALTPAAWVAFLTGYPNIVFSVVGHSHRNQLRWIQGASGGFWEVMASALADYPSQFRVAEIWDDDNGWLRMHTVVVNYSTDGDPVAAQGRTLGVIDVVSGWGPYGAGLVSDRNADLYIPKP